LEHHSPIQADYPPQSRQGLIALMATSLALFFNTFMTSGINIAIPAISHDFHADPVLLSWTVTGFLLVVGVLLLPFGRLSDIIGIKKVFFWGVIVFLVASAILVFSNSVTMLIACRFLQGIGSSMIFSTGTAIVSASNPSDQRGKLLGIFVSSIYLGYLAGPFLGGILTDNFGWRSIFAINIPVGIVVIFLILWKIKGEWAYSRGEKFDLAGSIICGLALVALIYGLSSLPGVAGIVLTIVGILGIFVFIKWENHVPSPMLNLDIFRHNKTLLLSNVSTLIAYGATFAISFFLSLYLQYIKAFSPEQAGIVLVSQPGILALLAPFTGRLSDKIEPRIVASIGMALIFGGLFFLSFINAGSSILLIVIYLLVIGLGMALFIPPNTNAVMGSVSPKFLGIASALNGTMRALGQLLSMAVAAVIMAEVIGKVIITADYYPAFIDSTRIAFGIFCALCFCGIFTSAARGKLR
jgi:EmrB/QacA subfamily drug resistance transporter